MGAELVLRNPDNKVLLRLGRPARTRKVQDLDKRHYGPSVDCTFRLPEDWELVDPPVEVGTGGVSQKVVARRKGTPAGMAGGVPAGTCVVVIDNGNGTRSAACYN